MWQKGATACTNDGRTSSRSGQSRTEIACNHCQNGRVLRVINLETICEHEEVVDDIRDGGDAAEVPQSRADPTIMVMLRRFPRAEQIP